MYTTKNKIFQKLEIGLASPKQIRGWAERYLPNGEIVGEVTSWETVNYKTLKPEPNGLFCQRIFGPIVDYTCACGKKSNKIQSGFCSKCGVERTTSRIRRYRLGYIKLKQPVVQTIYASHKPSPLALCLGWSNKRIQAVMYATEFSHLASQFKTFCSRYELFKTWYKYYPLFIKKKIVTELSIQPVNKLSTQQSLVQDAAINFKNKPIETQLNLTRKKSSNILVSTKTIKKNKPKFFSSKKSKTRKSSTLKFLYPFRKLEFGIHLYALSSDMTWRQVEEFQEFLLYSWEQAVQDEFFIPYYDFTQKTKPFFSKQKSLHPQYYPIQTGGYVFQTLFSSFNLILFQRQLRLQEKKLKKSIRYVQQKIDFYFAWEKEKADLIKKLNRLKLSQKKCLRRLSFFRDFHKRNIQPSWMILSYLPVLPPGLRPITSIRGELVVSDINSLYRKVLTRNKRVNNTIYFNIFDTALSGSWSSWCYNLRQVQEAVDQLLKTGSVEAGKKTKSILETLKGKKGRFRQHLLGKRVDYSGRSVIVVGPSLKIHECGIPKQMAIILFQPFIIQKLRKKGIAFTTTAAKAIISERKPIVWSLLEEIMRNHPVLLNRAPTLHRLGIQAFLPKLVEGKAIFLHPLVCPAFNADFDGDQMAVHVPLSPAARSEALNLLWSRNHLLAPASGQPLLLPTQDMVLGCYFLTIAKDLPTKNLNSHILGEKKTWHSQSYFADFSEVHEFYNQGKLEIHQSIWVRWSNNVQNFVTKQQQKNKELPLEYQIDSSGNSHVIFSDHYDFNNLIFSSRFSFIRTTPGRILFNEIITNLLSNSYLSQNEVLGQSIGDQKLNKTF